MIEVIKSLREAKFGELAKMLDIDISQTPGNHFWRVENCNHPNLVVHRKTYGEARKVATNIIVALALSDNDRVHKAVETARKMWGGRPQ